MAVNNVRQQIAYGLTNALQDVPYGAIVSKRAPLSSDKAPIGQIWVVPSTNSAWILTSVVANSATWDALGGSGSGVFASLEATTGNITADLGNIVATAGSVSAGTTVTAGTGVVATTGGVTASAGNIVATLGNITASAGNIAATLGSVAAGTTVTAGTGITSTTGNVTSTAGDLVASTAAKGVILGGGAKVVCGTGSPVASVTAPKGSLYLNLSGSGVADRAFINTDGVTAWAAVTSAS